MTTLTQDPVALFIATFAACIVLASIWAAFSLARQSHRTRTHRPRAVVPQQRRKP